MCATKKSVDSLEDDFIKSIKPFYYIQTILGSARINFKLNYLTPPTVYQKIYGFILVVSCCLTCYHLQSHRVFIVNLDKKSDLQVNLYLGLFYTAISVFVCVIIVNNFVYTEKNVKLFVNLQCLDRNLKFVGKEGSYKRLYTFSLYTCSFIVFIHTTMSLGPFLYINHKLPLFQILVTCPLLLALSVEDFETFLFLYFIYFLTGRVRYINEVIVRYVALYPEGKQLNPTKDSDTFRRIYMAYRCVINAFRLIKETFSLWLLFISFHAFCNLLMLVQEYIEQGKNIDWFQFFQLNGLVIKLIIRLIVLGTSINYFYIAVAETRQFCPLALETYTNGYTRRSIKNIIRIISVQMKPLSVYNMFYLHQLPMGLISLTATYTVVLLQFTFL